MAFRESLVNSRDLKIKRTNPMLARATSTIAATATTGGTIVHIGATVVTVTGAIIVHTDDTDATTVHIDVIVVTAIDAIIVRIVATVIDVIVGTISVDGL